MSSGGGVAFSLECLLPVNQSIRYIITFSRGSFPVRIVCSGKVVRCVSKPEGGFEIAATMEKYNFLSPEGIGELS
jgi:hypothetical protein